MGVDPGVLALGLRDFSNGALPDTRRTAEEVVEALDERAARARTSASTIDEAADGARNRAEDQRAQCEGVPPWIDKAERDHEGLAEHARRHRDRPEVAERVLDRELVRWQGELAKARADERAAARQAAMGPPAARAAARVRQQRAAARATACEEAVRDCRQALGIVALARRSAGAAVEGAVRERAAVDDAVRLSEESLAAVGTAEALAGQARQNAASAEDAAGFVTNARREAAEAADAVADASSAAERTIDDAVERLIMIDRGLG